MRYLTEKISRDYGIFTPKDPKNHKGCPPQQFDAEILFVRDLFDLDAVELLNYNAILEYSEN